MTPVAIEITAEALNPPADAVMVAVPIALVVTRPPSSTVATFGSELVHVMVGLASGPVAVATRTMDWPRNNAAVEGVSVTAVTPDVTVIVTLLLSPPAVAVTTATPADLAETRPLSSTVTLAGFDDVHVMTGLEYPPVTLATSCADWPMISAAVVGVTVTAVIGRSGAVTVSELHAETVAIRVSANNLRIMYLLVRQAASALSNGVKVRLTVLTSRRAGTQLDGRQMVAADHCEYVLAA